jgi:sugar phosphate isomerase/epimerase
LIWWKNQGPDGPRSPFLQEEAMKLGFVSAILPDLSLEEVLQFAAAENFQCVEVMCWPKGRAERRYAGITHIDVAGFGKAQAQRVQELCAASGVEISGLGYYPNPLTPDKAEGKVFVDHIKKVIRAAERLGLSVVNSFIGRDWTKTVDGNWPRFRQVWRPLIKFAEDHGVKIGIENCPMLFSNDEWPGGKNLAHSPTIWRRMFEEIPSDNFGLNYDPSHLVWQHMDYVKPLWEFADRIFHVHAKDVRIDRQRLDDEGILASPLKFHNPKIPGLGEIDWGRFISVLGDVGYRESVCVEVEDRVFEGSLESRKASLRQSGTFLSSFVV